MSSKLVYKVKRALYFGLITLFLSGCNHSNYSGFKVMTFFPEYGNLVSFERSYMAGINYAHTEYKGNEGAREILYTNINPLDKNEYNRTLNDQQFHTILGVFNHDILNDLIDKTVQIPLIVGSTGINYPYYDVNTNVFPLDVNIEDEVTYLAELLPSQTYILYSEDLTTETLALAVSEKLDNLNKHFSVIKILETTAFDSLFFESLNTKPNYSLTLLLNKAHYTRLLYDLVSNNSERTIYIPPYLHRYGQLPPNIEESSLTINALVYDYEELPFNSLYSEFLEICETNNDCCNYASFVNGYRAFNYFVSTLNSIESPVIDKNAIVQAMHKKYANNIKNASFAVV